MRNSELDRLRGIAILLMVIDHSLLVIGTGAIVRNTLTRASLPLFCLVAGNLYKGPMSWHRLLQVGAAGLVATWIGYPLGIGQPDVLMIILLAMSLLSFRVMSAPLAVGLMAIQPVTWQIGSATGYSLGLVFTLCYIGKTIPRAKLTDLGSKLPRWLELIGKFPLSIYLAHLAVLALLFNKMA